jgi:hypothetical protein
MTESGKVQYVDSSGRVPRGVTDIDNANLFKTLLLTSLVLAYGGSVELYGFSTPEDVARLMNYELKVTGTGTGRFLVEAVAKNP